MKAEGMNLLKENASILYHGSRGGIKGNIQPVSREICDFGQGFYVGTAPYQTIGIVSDENKPFLYELKINFSKIPQDRILFLEKKDWLYTVLAHRQSSELFNASPLAEKYVNFLKPYDVVVGNAVDDCMAEAINAFSNLTLTEEGFYACLSSVQCGQQIVFRTEFACEQLEIISEKELGGLELQRARQLLKEKRQEGLCLLRTMQKKYRRSGLYLDELLDDRDN